MRPAGGVSLKVKSAPSELDMLKEGRLSSCISGVLSYSKFEMRE